MLPSVEEIDESIRALESAKARLAAAASSSRALIDGLTAALHMRANQLAAQLVPRADDAALDRVAEALGNPEVSSSALRARIDQRASELRGAPAPVSAEQLRATEEGRARVEAAAATLRAEVQRLERSAASREPKGLRGVLASLGGKSTPKEDDVLVQKRRELSSLEEDARQAATDAARMRHAYVKSAEAQAALRALPSDAFTATRAMIAGQVASAPAATLRQVCASLAKLEVDQILLLRAKQRYAAAVASRLVEAPFMEVSELAQDAQRWRAGVVDGGLPVPEKEFVEGRTAQMVAKAQHDVERAERINARIDAFALTSPVPDDDPVWWDIMFGDSEDGAFITEVRNAASLAVVVGQPADEIPLSLPTTVPDAGELEEIDTARWLERFYGKALELDALHIERTAERIDADATQIDAPATVTDVRAARRVGPYVLIEKLGAGGMAEVHLAQEKSTSKRRVVKLMQPQLATDPAYVAMFEREARIGMELVHENIVRTHELINVDDEHVLILEYVEGVSAHRLCAWLRSQREGVSVGVSALLASDCASGLAYAHGRIVTGGAVGVIHRDISPDNLLCGMNGVAKISDFGIARAEKDQTLTRTGELKGKLPFMAPELFEGDAATAASDVFALGVSLYWFLTGARPFHRPTEGALIRAIMTLAPAPPGTRVSGIPPELDVLVLEMLAKDKSARPSAADVVERLRPFVAPRNALAALVSRAVASR